MSKKSLIEQWFARARLCAMFIQVKISVFRLLGQTGLLSIVTAVDI